MDQKAINAAVAKVIPFVLLAIITYASFVVTKPLVIDFMLAPGSPNHAGAIVVLVLHYLGLFYMVVCYLRLILTIIYNPGYIPKGYSKAARPSNSEKPYPPCLAVPLGETRITGDFGQIYENEDVAAEHLRSIVARDAYACQDNGYPPWCTICSNWKDDRAHHCRELDRCVYRMDHYCPWAGGIVSETTFKFFIQFTFFAGLHCLFLLAVSIYGVVSKGRMFGTDGFLVSLVVISGFFGIFSLGIFGSSMQLVLAGLTTIERLDHKRRSWTLAVELPSNYRSKVEEPGLRIITWPSDARRKFAIMSFEKGVNPFYHGWKGNFLEVMGVFTWEWVLPITNAPMTNHSRKDYSRYAINQNCYIEAWKKAGLEVTDEEPIY